MNEGAVTVLVPLLRGGANVTSARREIERFLESTGFESEVLVLSAQPGEDYGALLRRGVADAKGSTIVIADPALPYSVGTIGDAVAMIQSEATDIVFATKRSDGGDDPRHILLRWTLVPILPDPAIRLMAFSADAAKLVIGETKLSGGGCDLEIAFLANKYGFRIERLHVACDRDGSKRAFGPILGLTSAIAIRLTDRRMAYRASRRCPVCFSSEVWSWAQIPGNIVRACKRCKSRFLNQVMEDDESHPVRRVLRPHAPPPEPGEETQSSHTARDRTSLRRLAALDRTLTPRARLLQVGVGDGSFGVAASREYEYVGIDGAPAAARAARAKGLEAYCATLSNFVNTGPAFDAIALFHVFEDMADPHDALARIKDLLKPGGVLFMTTFDTEGLLYLITERRRMMHNFRTHMILYSRSALIELLEHSGFEIDAIGPDFEYRDHKFLRYRMAGRWPLLAPFARSLLTLLPDPLLVSSGSIRILAKRRAGPPVNVRAVRSVEPTHAR